MQDYFSLFGLPERYALDMAQLEQAYRKVQAQVHPDRYAHRPEAERRVAMQWATLANEAHRALRNPVARARYLLSRRGTEIDAERNTAMSPAFLMQQMEWREAVEEAAGDAAALAGLLAEMESEESAAFDALARALDETPDAAAAAETVRRLMFIERLRSEIEEAMAG
ncbi:MAG: Fe-S protein assembly co-chaperone HscB [Rhodocyclaceae bacterium]